MSSYAKLLPLLGLIALTGCGQITNAINPGAFHAGGGPATVRMDGAAWDFRNERGVVGHPTPGPVAFVWQTDVDMLTTDVSIQAKERIHTSVKIEAVSGAATFRCSEGGEDRTPPAFSLFIEVRNDNLTVLGDGRWWYEAVRPALSIGNFTIDAPFSNLAGWRNAGGIYATARPDQFKAALANLGAVGGTFGCVAFAHGATPVGGTVRLTITEYTVQ